MSTLIEDCFSLRIGTLLRTGVRAASGATVITTHGGMTLTYVELQERVRRLGSALTRLGVSAGSKVAVLERDNHRYLEAYFAVPMTGAVLMTANIRLSAEQLRYTLEHSNAQLVIAAPEFLPLLKEAFRCSEAPPIVTTETLTGEAARSGLRLLGNYEDLLHDADLHYQFPSVDEDAVATLFYTTGTTGLPKGVSYSHRQIVAHTLALGVALAAADSYQSLRVSDVYMPLTPMFHVHAWGMPYLATMLGLKQVYPGRYDASGLPALILRHGVTFSHCVPTVLQMVLEAARAQGLTFNGWKVMVGGSAMTPSLARGAQEAGIQPFAGYGMSETCPVLCFARANAQDAACDVPSVCAVGQLIPLVEMKLQLPSGGLQDSRDPDIQGELVVRSPWLTKGYYKDANNTASLWADGYLHTGDVASIDEKGVLRIVDRMKDVIKSGGEWISSLEIEARLCAHPAVLEAAVVGVPNEKWGERPYGFIRLAADWAASAESVRAELRAMLESEVAAGRLARFALPDDIRAVDSIPKTSVGKTDKKRLRAELAR